MVLAIVLVGVLWFQFQEVLTDFQCPEMADCSCGIYFDGVFEISCPKTSNQRTLTASFVPNQYIRLECIDMKEWEDVRLVSGLKIGPVDDFFIERCPPPGISIKELMATVGIRSTKNLFVKSRSNLSGTLTSRYLEGLHELESLNLDGNDLTKLPEDLFKDVENLIRLTLENYNVKLTKGIFRYVPKLEELRLLGNNINHLEPGIFRNLTKLKVLDLSRNRLQNLSRSVFSDIPNLEILYLNYNGLKTLPPDVFADLKELKSVNLNKNNFQTLPQRLFRNTQQLEKITIYKNRGTLKSLPPAFFANLTQLKALNLYASNLSSLPEDLLWGCVSLKNLMLQKNLLTELPEKIFKDTKDVTSINLSFNRLVSLPGSLFSSQQKLENLDLSHNKLTNMSQGLFSPLYEKGFMRFSIFNMPHKLSFDHGYFDIGKSLITPVIRKYEKIESIDLSYNQLSTVYSDWRDQMVSLQYLNLSHNNFTNLTMGDLQFEANKVTLDFRNNKITMFLMNEAEEIAQHKSAGRMIILLEENPFVCDCHAYHLVKYFRGQLDPKVKMFVSIEGSELTCDGPEELKGTRVVDLDPRQLTCSVEKLLEENDCPKNCSCLYRPRNSALLVNCSYRGLTNIPPSLPTPNFLEEWMIVNHTELNLTGNKITFLPNKLGIGYSNVTKIYLSYNNLTSINLASFSDHLQIIELDHNNLTRVDEEFLKTMKKWKHIKKISLQNNPWICDCQAISFLNFIQVVDERIPNHENLTCSNGDSISKLTVSELCRVTMATAVVTISVTLAFVCLLIGGSVAVYYSYQREIKVWLYANKLCLWFVTEEELDKDKLYDAFISYSHQDEKFVVEDLVPGLENGPTKFKLCLHYRDWVVGEFIPDQIARSVEESRRTVVILSSNFLESVWGRMEFRTAHSQALSEGRVRVIIILYGDIGPVDNLDPELKAYLSMNTYIKWGDPWFWEKLRYALPHPPQLSNGIPLISNSNIRRNSGEEIMDGTDPISMPPAITRPPADALFVEPE